MMKQRHFLNKETKDMPKVVPKALVPKQSKLHVLCSVMEKVLIKSKNTQGCHSKKFKNYNFIFS